MLTGQNGILNRASEAQEKTQIAQEKEVIGLAYSGVLAGNKGERVTATELQTELRNNGYTNATAVDNGDGTITVTFETENSYTIDANGNISGPTGGEITPPTIGKTDGSFDAEKGVNTPKIDEAKGMELVKYDEGTQEWVKDETNSTYSYEEQPGTTENGGTSKWANAKVTINGVESYFVWIPRYAYKIDSASQTIDIKFIKDTGKTATDETECKYADDETLDTNTDYIIHPAFTTNADLGGGWNTELPGLWIGKYEVSSVEGNSNTAEGDNVLTKTIQIIPGAESWRNISIGNMYTNAINYLPNLKSHMLKNSEWGAIAYLTHSKYGRNGIEIAINNSNEFITGMSGGKANASESDTKYEYNTEKGVLASSTGNVYGIYDLSGGAWEHVASYYKDTTLTIGSSFADGLSDKYSTAYDGVDLEEFYKNGDATKETSGWNDDYELFIDKDSPFFIRGGYYKDGSNLSTGIFYYSRGYYNNNFSTYRISLAV